MEATTTTTIRCHLKNGEAVDLSPADCAEILNAMARRRLLTVSVENIPDDLIVLHSEDICAWASEHDPDDEGMDEGVFMSVDAGVSTFGITRDKPKAKKKR
jgi:hypothetical protein